jgi:hypothetical protein
MARRILLVAANSFVVAYALDAAISVLETVVRSGMGPTLLGPLRDFVAHVVVVASFAGLPLLALTPRLPLSVFLPLILSALWFLIGTPPVASHTTREAYGLVVCLIQLGITAAVLVRIRFLNGGNGWLFREPLFDGPLFSARYTLTYAVALLILAVPVTLLSLASAVTSAVESQTSGFVTFDSDGVLLDDRRYVHDEQEIRLIGMMHLGEPDTYRDIFTSFATGSTLVLAEGISDVQGVMNSTISYGGVARALGLEQQQYVTNYLSQNPEEEASDWPVVRRADLDASDFAPETIEGLERISRAWASESPLLALLTLIRRADEDPDIWTSLVEDILNRRNEHLVAEIDSSVGEYERIVIPWGALHMPTIEQAIQDRGFERVSSVRHRLISWATLLAVLAP